MLKNRGGGALGQGGREGTGGRDRGKGTAPVNIEIAPRQLGELRQWAHCLVGEIDERLVGRSVGCKLCKDKALKCFNRGNVL